ncbi:MAG: hypothetical protein QOC95_1051 [Thermoleophilaceae bacterium]|nr:hypothetical protein [Thermoleophilaceae bacterium]
MSARTDIFDLGRLGLSSGEGRHLDLSVYLDPLQFGGERYTPAPADVPVKLDVSRTTGNGWFMRLRFDARLSGPCMRCLEDAEKPLDVDIREVHQPGAEDADLDSPYLKGDELDLQAWARDALVLELPTQIVCRDDCKGLCAICGEDLNTAGPDHHHEAAPDPRWAKLGELKLD